MLYKMYYRSNIKLIYLFATNKKCDIFFLQVDILIKKFRKHFQDFPIPSRSDKVWDGTG